MPRVAGRGQGCCSDGSVLVLFRVAGRKVEKIRTFSEDCQLDAGGVPFYWLTGAHPPESVALLSSFVSGKESRVGETAPEWLREEAAFWLGAARGQRGYELLRWMLREDPSGEVREKAVFALSVSPGPEAVDTLVHIARTDRSVDVRGQALFWLAQKAGKKAAAALTEAIEADPELEVKKRAVLALSQLPPEEGVPLLIRVARTNRSRQIRERAICWLGQSNDPRALTFFEEILTR
jgi:HEAT repeat protein